ncbi:hypothetical protein GCM10009416_51660 [Craurococcus roseus]|uniref:Uncharacterized protein n=2 Tax=Craurococcus roseus TaxID=77585 RepID=A0ABP3RJR5_9PROT
MGVAGRTPAAGNRGAAERRPRKEVVSTTGPVVYGADRMAANPADHRSGGAPRPAATRMTTHMPKGAALPLLLTLLAAGACGAAPPPTARSDVERGTALPPPGLDAGATARR